MTLVSAMLWAEGPKGSRVTYMGGTLPGVEGTPAGEIYTVDPENFVFLTREARVQVPYERVNLLEYGQNVSRRVALAVLVSPMLILSKSRKHFLTVGYADDNGKQHAMVFRVSKNDIRLVLVTLEARTGQKVQYQDDEARKAGRG